ncbi:MAG: hypothetical protein V8S33_13620 [Intestinibacter bartlettii]
MHNIKEFIDMNEKDFDSFFNILDNSFPKVKEEIIHLKRFAFYK